MCASVAIIMLNSMTRHQPNGWGGVWQVSCQLPLYSILYPILYFILYSLYLQVIILTQNKPRLGTAYFKTGKGLPLRGTRISSESGISFGVWTEPAAISCRVVGTVTLVQRGTPALISANRNSSWWRVPRKHRLLISFLSTELYHGGCTARHLAVRELLEENQPITKMQ